MESVEVIAERVGWSVDDTKTTLQTMAERGFVWSDKEPTFRLAPFVVGIYEAQLETMDHELSHLVEMYMAEGGQQGL